MASNKVKMSDDKIDLLINLWHMEPSLWDSSHSTYSNADVRKAALRRIIKTTSSSAIAVNVRHAGKNHRQRHVQWLRLLLFCFCFISVLFHFVWTLK